MSSQLVKLATCNLNQWALDFDGNLARIRESIVRAKQQKCRFRLGPELEIPGYGCEDHFYEVDTFFHSWDCLAELLQDGTTDDILCDIGMPVMHRDVAYNCRVYVLNRRILGIRPKLYLANDGNYRETRWFSEWSASSSEKLESFYLPRRVLAKLPEGHPTTVPIGNFVIRAADTVVGSETCEELFTPNAPHITMSLDGVEIITNGSGSHHQLRKLSKRIDLIKSATVKSGGIYVYANQLGCDGGRLFYDGCCMVWENGNLLAQGTQFGMKDVEVVVAVCDLKAVHTTRTCEMLLGASFPLWDLLSVAVCIGAFPLLLVPFPRVDREFKLKITPKCIRYTQKSGFKSRSKQAADSDVKYPRVEVDFALCDPTPGLARTPYRAPFVHSPMEEIAYGPSTWLWDYLRRSGT